MSQHETHTPVPQFSPALQAQLSNNKLRPTMTDMAHALGRPIRYRKDKHGRRIPYIRLQQNERAGKASRDGQIMQEMIGPWAQAEVERHANSRGWPGGYAGRGQARTLKDYQPCREYCTRCDRLAVWCECPRQDKEVGEGSRRGRGRRAARRGV